MTPPKDIFLERNVLQQDARSLLVGLVEKHLEIHDGNSQSCLASVSWIGSVRDALEGLQDRDVEASLVYVASASQRPDPCATLPAALGDSTSSGQRFHILRPHARGSLGQVSVALDRGLHREVALKEIQLQYADDGNSSSFTAEAEITGGLEHPGIVPVYGLGQYADGRPLYAMRFVRGHSLQEAIEQYQRGYREAKRSLRFTPPAVGSAEGSELGRRSSQPVAAPTIAHNKAISHITHRQSNTVLFLVMSTRSNSFQAVLLRILYSVAEVSTCRAHPTTPVSS